MFQRSRLAVILGCAVVASAVGFAVNRASAPGPTRAVAPAVTPKWPTSLAVAPNGDLYVSDPGRQQILVRLPGGRFEVAAGTGVAGFSGDGRPATRAEIDDPSSLAVAKNGALYFEQQGKFSSMIREVEPNGTIETVVGAHPDCGALGANGRIAADDSVIGDAALAFGPNGILYISGRGCLGAGPLLELTSQREIVEAPLSPVIAKAVDCGGGGLAFAPSGEVYVACDSGGGHIKEVLAVAPNGSTTAFPGVYPYDDASGFASAPVGSVVAIDFSSVVRITPSGIRTIIDLGDNRFLGRFDGHNGSMEPSGIAVDREGNIYLASTPGFGNGTFNGVIEISHDGRVQVLWSRNI